MLPGMETLAAQAARHAGDIVRLAIQHDPAQKALVVFDARSPLARLVTEAYRAALPEATFIDFDATTPEEVIAAIGTLAPKDLVVLIQSLSFQLAAFRFRIELFQRGIAVVEHVHLERSTDDAQITVYVDAMAYDAAYYRGQGEMLRKVIDAASTFEVRCEGTVLRYEGGMEPVKLNVGDYSGMKNIGGTFPIGEVFTEPRDFAQVNGEAMIFAFAGIDHLVQMHPPFKIRVEKGILVSHEGPPAFQAILDQISSEEVVLVREFGLGLNRAMGKSRLLSDITAFERQLGLHFSLGEKHTVYKKPGLHPKKTHFHIDIFVDVQRIEADGVPLYEGGRFLVG
jgi:hypothetical protein